LVFMVVFSSARIVRQSAAHKQVEGEGRREDVVLLELRGCGDAATPADEAEGRAIEAGHEEQAAGRLAQAAEEA
jgi:hypothetical protein